MILRWAIFQRWYVVLVISRKQGESIIVDERIVFTIVETRQINGEIKVRVGIEAPRECSIYRREVYGAIRRDPDDRA